MICRRHVRVLVVFACWMGSCAGLQQKEVPPGSSDGSDLAPHAPSSRDAPNVVLIVTDDQGFGDLGCFGHPTINTPNIDRLASGGLKLTQFYVASPVCSPSRAAFLTGCYPKRVGMHRHVVFPEDDFGLHPDEETLAELLKRGGYRTGCFGKWHLGHRRGFMPTDQGFDSFEGVPYSNDMAQFHRPTAAKYMLRLPWMRGTEVVEWEPDQRLLTKRQTDAALAFIRQSDPGTRAKRQRNDDPPFFAYIPYSMPHIPIYASGPFTGTSARGAYGDVIEEIDASVGRIVNALEETGELQETLLIFTSDNGPWLQYGLEGGSAGLLRGGKGTNFEGGQRVPFIAHWPGRVPAGVVSREVTTAMDLLPTLVSLAGAPTPTRTIDGRNITATLTRPSTNPLDHSPFLLYTSRGELAGIRRGPWKLFLEQGELYNVEVDVAEAHDASGEHPDVVRQLRAEAHRLDAEIEANARPRGVVAEALFDPVRPE